MAPDGNQNAVKWTLERTLETLKTIEQYSYSPDCQYLGHALSLAHVYDDLWAYWRKKWRGNYAVTSLMKVIQQRFEARIVDKAITGKMPVHFTTFMLKHHYGWNREATVTPPQPDMIELAGWDALPDPAPEAVVVEQPAAAASAPEVAPEKAKALPEKPVQKPTKAQSVTFEKLTRYNKLHPDKALIPPIAYFDGKPPSYLPTVLFEDGYFVRAEF
ncbi:MAG: hypothetical protein JST76_01330 [Bacteroidetes bacterium]|nr:hypothetical protein [Bacteroidota bacterium]